MTNLLITTLVTLFLFALVTYSLARIFKTKRYVKYLPALISLILVLYNLYLSQQQTLDAAAFMRIALTFLLAVGFIAGLLTALWLDFIFPKFFKK